MLAITNDAWYGRTGAPHQFLAMTAMRAAENARYIVRAANTGISAIIDDRGRIRDHSALFEDAVVIGEVPVSLGEAPTFYARYGDVFAALCGLTVLPVLVRSAYVKKRRAKQTQLKQRHTKPAGAIGEEAREG
jgi:apolipoprotein N-acyltransferase